MLKITRYGHGGLKILAHARYIARHGKLTLEDEAGDRIDDPVLLRRRVRAWIEQAGAAMEEPAADMKRKRRVTAHLVLDAGPGADPRKLTQATREFLAQQFGKRGHEYVFVRHDDTKQPHVHVVLNLMDERGKRLHTSVAELQAWREGFAETARKQGIEVDASRAWERGKGVRRSRGPVRAEMNRPAPWTREQVRRGLEARRRKRLSEAATAEGLGDMTEAMKLRDKALSLNAQLDRLANRLRQDVKPVSIEHQTDRETASRRNARQVAKSFMAHARTLEAKHRETTDALQRDSLRRAAATLRTFAEGLSSQPVRANELASETANRSGNVAENEFD